MDHLLRSWPFWPAVGRGNKYSQLTAQDSATMINGDQYTYIDQRLPPGPTQEVTGHVHWLVKRKPNNLFTGQEDILHRMEQDVSKQPRRGGLVLQGMGGTGKSELALQFAERHWEQYWAVIFVDCTTKDRARSGFRKAARKCGHQIDADDDVLEQVVEWLSNLKQSWLLVLDNCDDPDVDYQHFFPENSQGDTIMTTRLGDVNHYAARGKYIVEGLTQSSAVELLFKYTAETGRPQGQDAQEAARSIVQRLSFHPLAITIAGSVIRKGIYTLDGYAAVLPQKLDELSRERPRQAQSIYGTIYDTFEISARKLSESKDDASKHALELLSILAFMDRTNIDAMVFTRAWKFSVQLRDKLSKPERMPWITSTPTPHNESETPGVTDVDQDETKLDEALYSAAMALATSGADKPFAPEDADTAETNVEIFTWWQLRTAMSVTFAHQSDFKAFREARAQLHDLSLVSGDLKSPVISIHPLIQSWAKSRLSKDEYTDSWIKAATTLALSLEGNAVSVSIIAQLGPHMESCFQSMTLDDDWMRPNSVNIVSTLFLFAPYLLHTESALLLEMLRTIKRSLLLLDPIPFQAVAAIFGLHGFWLIKSGSEPGYAIAALTRADDIYSALSPDHVNHFEVSLGLARVNASIGQLHKAIAQLEIMTPSAERIFGATSQTASECTQTLATLYAAAGLYARAMKILEDLILLRSKEPSRSLCYFTSRRLLAEIHLSAGNVKKSIEVTEDIVKTLRETPSGDSGALSRCLVLLANSYFEDGQAMRAKETIDELERSQAVISKHGREQVQFLKLRLSLWESHHYGRDVERQCRQEQQGRLPEAIEICERVLEIRLKEPKYNYFHCMIDRMHLARLYLKDMQGLKAKEQLVHLQRHQSQMAADWRWQAHLRIIERVLNDWEVTGEVSKWFQYLGPSDEKLNDYERQGNFTEPIDFNKHICEILPAALPAEHPGLLVHQSCLARLYLKAGEGTKAKELIDHLRTLKDSFPVAEQVELLRLQEGLAEWNETGKPGRWFSWTGPSIVHLPRLERHGRFEEVIEIREKMCKSLAEFGAATLTQLLGNQLGLTRVYLKNHQGEQARELLGCVQERVDEVEDDLLSRLLLLIEGAVKEWESTGKIPEATWCTNPGEGYTHPKIFDADAEETEVGK